MRYSLFSLLLLPLLFSACGKDSCEQSLTYTRLTPAFVSPADFRNAPIVLESSEGLRDPGRMYYYGQTLLINERNRGIHLYDNRDPRHPVALGYLAIPGNTDFVVRNGIVYANQYTDLLALDLSDPANVLVLDRTENISSPLETNAEGDIATYYNREEVTETVDCDARQRIEQRGFDCWNCEFFDRTAWNGTIDFAQFDNAGVGIFSPLAGTANSGSGTGGSMARFTLFKDHLYTVDERSLRAFTFDGPTVSLSGETPLWWGIETIIPHDEHLYIGSQTGMFIFETSNPAEPTQVGVFQHARACDPVYVKDNFAYVTLRDGTPCAGFANQLDLVDVTDPTAPRLVESFGMQHPHGLGIADDELFVCEGEYGLKAFDISIPTTLDERPLWHAERWHAYDVIPLPSDAPTLLMIGDDGFLQLDISDPDQPELLSTIPVIR